MKKKFKNIFFLFLNIGEKIPEKKFKNIIFLFLNIREKL